MTTASFSVCCRNSWKSLFQFVSNHCNYLRIFFSSKLKLNSCQWNSFCSEPREVSVLFINLKCARRVSEKKLHFCSDLGRRFDGPGRYRRIGMTGEVCTELRVASAPKQQHGERGEREHRARGDQECFVTSRWPTNVPILHPIPNCRIAADTLRPGTLAPHSQTLIGVLTRESAIAAQGLFTELHCSAA